MCGHENLRKRIERYLKRRNESETANEIARYGLEILPTLRDFLLADLPIETTERLESILKAVLRQAFASPCSGPNARRIAVFQKTLGFILKYKSYSVKASDPLGYSIFLHNQGEGFSFQRHLTHKTEVFHILEVMPGGFVFLCGFDDWAMFYDRQSCDRWLAGEPNALFDQHKFIPAPGDVFVISELGIVHTVIGCVLEEFATTSTDMVDRLHDQNLGKPIPPYFNRGYANAKLHALKMPETNRIVDTLSPSHSFESVQPTEVRGGHGFILADSFVTASRYVLEPRSESAVDRDDHRASSVHIFSGAGTIVIADESELDCLSRVSSPFVAGDQFLIPPGIYYGFKNESTEPLKYSEHRILPEVAFA